MKLTNNKSKVVLIQLFAPLLESVRITRTVIDKIEHFEEQKTVFGLSKKIFPKNDNEEESHLFLTFDKLL